MAALLRFFNELRTWSSLTSDDLPNPITTRLTFTYSPVFDLASGALSVNTLYTTTGVTVPANTNYSDIRITQPGGGNNTFTVGAGGIVAAIVASPESLAGSDSTSNVYGAVLHATNDGPGTTKGVHAGAFAQGASTGVIVASNNEVTPVATTNTASCCTFSSLVSSAGNHDIVTAYAMISTGDRFKYGVGSAISPIPIGTAFYQAWMATGSSAGARAFQTLANDGTELSYIDKLGAYHTPASTTAQASLNIPSGTAPTSPVNGDIWFDGTSLHIRINGSTKTFTVT